MVLIVTCWADLLPADEVPFINLEFDLYELLECLSSGDEPLSVIARELLTFLAGDESPIIEHMVQRTHQLGPWLVNIGSLDQLRLKS